MAKPHANALLALALSLALLSPSAAAQCVGTQVTGPVIDGETWTPAGSPYCVTERIDVQSLTILPGTEIRVDDNDWIRVIGTITAIGTANDPIVFTAIDPLTPWRGLIFVSAPTGSTVSFCQFSETRVGGCITLNESTPTINNCSFFNAPRSGIRVLVTTGDVTIEDCTFDTANTISGGAIDADMGTNNLTITRCTFNNCTSNGNGGAIDTVQGGGNCVIDSCTFNGSNATGLGGAIFAAMTGGQLIVTDSTFRNNTADLLTFTGDGGGGAIGINGDASVTGSTFDGNMCRGHRTSQTAIGRGGALFSLSGNLSLTACLLTGNTAVASYENIGVGGRARAYGGAVFTSFGTLTATNCTFTGNAISTDGTTDVEELGAGIYSEGFFPVNLVNCTVTRGLTTSGADAGVHLAGGFASIRNSILYFNGASQISGAGAATVTYSNVEGGHAGVGNIDTNPLFVSGSGGCDIITPFSPCVDAGDPNASDNDLCFPPSLGGVRNDMGAQGGPFACSWTGPTNLLLTATPNPTTTPGVVVFDIAGGVPGMPTALFITAVNSVPFLFGLPFIATICPDGTASIVVPAPATTPGTVLDMQAYSFSAPGMIVGSNIEPLVFQ